MRNLVLITCSFVLIFLYLFSFLTLYYFPIYPDEVSWRLMISRMIYDFPNHFNLLSACEFGKKSFPIVWFIPGLIEWFIHAKIVFDHRIIRIIGLCFYLIFTSFLSWKLIIEIQHKTLKNCIIAIAGVLSLLSIGVLPFFLVLNRGEQNIFIGLMILLLLFEKHKFFKNPFLPFAIFFIAVSIVFYAHPKGFYLTPLIIFICYRLSIFYNLNMYSQCITFGFLFIQIVFNYLEWTKLFKCKDKEIDFYIKNFNIDISNLIYNPRMFFNEILENIINFPIYFMRIGFQEKSQANYLPHVQINEIFNFVNFFIYLNCALLLIFLFLYSLKMVYCSFRNKNRKYSPINTLTLLLIACIFIGSILLNTTKEWYDVGYLWTMIIISIILLISKNLNVLNKHNYYKYILVYFIITSIFSLCCLNYLYFNKLASGYAGPGVSIVGYQSERIKSDLNSLLSKCNFNNSAKQRLIVDDFTYFFLQKTHHPMLITYLVYRKVIPSAQDLSVKEEISQLYDPDIDGFLMQCRYFYVYGIPGFNEGELCCVRNEWF